MFASLNMCSFPFFVFSLLVLETILVITAQPQRLCVMLGFVSSVGVYLDGCLLDALLAIAPLYLY